jgi:hypothetical protein
MAAVLLVAAALLWWTGRPEPAGRTVSSIGASGALELTMPVAPSAPPSSSTPAATTDAPPPTPAPTDQPASPPTRVRVPTLGVDAPIEPVGVRDDGAVQVPDDVAAVGWYRFGPAPGAGGSAVLVGPVDHHSQGVGVLARVGELTPGDPVEIVDGNGATRRFTVVARERWPKEQTPMARLFDRDGQPRLVLITCGGTFDAQRLAYADNIAVTAAPIA